MNIFFCIIKRLDYDKNETSEYNGKYYEGRSQHNFITISSDSIVIFWGLFHSFFFPALYRKKLNKYLFIRKNLVTVLHFDIQIIYFFNK